VVYEKKKRGGVNNMSPREQLAYVDSVKRGGKQFESWWKGSIRRGEEQRGPFGRKKRRGNRSSPIQRRGR